MSNIITQISSFLSGSQSGGSHYNLYQQSNTLSEIERAKHFQKQYDYYLGDIHQIKKYVEATLLRTFSADDVNEFQLPFILIVKRVVDKISMAYLEPAERYFQVDKTQGKDENGNTIEATPEGQKKQAELFEEIIGNTNINSKVKMCYRFAKLSDVCHIRVVWRNERIEYDIIPSHLITVKEKPDDYTQPEAILMRFIKADKNGEDKLTYMYMDENETILMNDQGMFKESTPNEYKILTVLPMRIRETENYFGEGDSSLVDINEKIIVALVNAFDNMIMQSHGQPFGVNLGLEAGSLKTGPKHMIEVNKVMSDMATPTFEFVQPNPSTKEAMEFIDWMIKEACIQRGLPPFSVSTDTVATSGASKIMDNLELMEIRQDDIEILKEFEHKLYEITRAVWNFHNPSRKLDEKMRFAVEFEEQTAETTELEELNAKKIKLAMGLWTPVEDFTDPDNGVDETMALDIVKQNLAIRNELNDEFGIMQALDKALQTDNNDPMKSMDKNNMNINKGMMQ